MHEYLTGYAAGVGLGRILDALNIKYITHMKKGSGIEEESEIHIVDKVSQKRMLDIFEKTGTLSANVQIGIEPINANFANNPLLQQVR